MKDIKILVVTHKDYPMPKDREMYLPIQSGAALYPGLGIAGDDTGDNISEKNPAYNELCPMYWAWKNLKADYLGMCHYRRLFSDDKKSGTDALHILTEATAEKLLDTYDILLPPKRHFYIYTAERHYVLSKKGYAKIQRRDMEALRAAVARLYPDYSPSLERVLRRHSAHLMHMCLMARPKFDEYCEFMFAISAELERLLMDRLDKRRYIGGITELLMDIWIDKNGYRYYETGIIELEHKLFAVKCFQSLKRRFLGNSAEQEQANIVNGIRIH